MRGFPPNTRFTAVPDPLLGPLLEQIDDLAELKCILRLLWFLKDRKDAPRYVTEGELLADHVLNRGLAYLGDPQEAIRGGLRKAMERGILLALDVQVEGQPRRLYFLNDEDGSNAVDNLREEGVLSDSLLEVEGEPPPPERANIFTLYEENIGMLTPIQADRLREAEKIYPSSWIREAFEEAVTRNVRNWRYIESILERWARDGRGENGKPGRYPEKISLKEYRRRYGGSSGG